MPYYRCAVPKDSIPYDRRAAIAKAFTDVHCGATGAPRSFVHVVFDEADDRWDTPYFIDGGNRAGRPEAKKRELLEGLTAAFIEHAGVAPSEVSGRITEGPASWTMEGGKILPEPGEETEEWYAHDQRIGAAAAAG